MSDETLKPVSRPSCGILWNETINNFSEEMRHVVVLQFQFLYFVFPSNLTLKIYLNVCTANTRSGQEKIPRILLDT
jgi:hypothetical protein